MQCRVVLLYHTNFKHKRSYMKTSFRMHTLFLFISSILLLPGCTTIINWSKKNFYQGIESPQDNQKIRSFIRSTKVYDQFSTFAHFDVLWLAEEVRNAYVMTYVHASGKREEQKNQLLKLQKDELKHFITFYVITPQDTILNTEQSPWHVFLMVDNLSFDPIEIKIIEPNSIYKSFFGKLYNRFKTVYQIKFEARDLYDNPLIISTTQAIELHFKKLHKEILLRWDLLKTENKSPLHFQKEEKIMLESRNEQARLRKKNKKAVVV